MPAIEQDIAEINALLSPPGIYLKVCRPMRDERADIDDFDNVMIVAPNSSSRILKLVNNPCFELAETVG